MAICPTIGIICFIGLYVYSTRLYPGGSQENLNSIGFDWINNYWCNLMNVAGMNGQPNAARPFSITAMVILCFSLTLFFVQFANQIAQNKFWKFVITFLGSLAMLCSVFIFTEYHDLMIVLASIFGAFVVLGIIWEVFRSGLIFIKYGGIICVLFLAINNLIYFTEKGISALALIQKVTFGCVLLWVVCLNIIMVKYRKKKTSIKFHKII
ncbi:MAG: hypothetical protein ACPG6V_08010 [Flavobacteriales bacterium]